MGVAKFDDGILDNVKFEAPGPAACWLWFCSVLACRRGLSDGFISMGKVRTLVPGGLPNVMKHAGLLVKAGLWDVVDGGFRVHDYLDWNPSKAIVEDYRRRDKARKHREHPERIPDGFPPDSDGNPSGFHSDSGGRGASRAGAKSESEKKSKSEEESKSKNPVFPSPAKREPGLYDGAAARRHGQHAWCDLDRGLCVPYGLHDEFRKRSLKTDDELKAWYRQTVTSLGADAVGDDLFVFWRNQFGTWVGTVSRPPPHAAQTRSGDSLDAAKRSARRAMEQLAADVDEEDPDGPRPRQIKG